ncbi:hypothetical protein FOCC_FOCC015240, partial [Frankliniella occidentalis]
MLRLTELQALQVAIQRRENVKSLELISYGDAFWKTVRAVQTACAEFLVSFIHELTKKLPSSVESVEKM